MAKEKKEKDAQSAEKNSKKRKTLDGDTTAEQNGAAPDGDATEITDVAKSRKILLSPIAQPLADDKLRKRTLKLVKKSAKGKLLKRGVKEVVKALRKQTTGLCIIAGDISPLDVVAHLPIMCEDRDIPYVFVPSKEELGAAGQTKRPTSCMLILREPVKAGAPADELKEFQEAYDDVYKRVKAVQVIY